MNQSVKWNVIRVLNAPEMFFTGFLAKVAKAKAFALNSFEKNCHESICGSY